MEPYIILAGSEFFDIIIRTVVVFLYAFLLLRLLGRKRLSHVTYLDVLLIIAFGSAVGDAMIYDESTTRLLASLTAITVVTVLIKILDTFSVYSKTVNNFIEGTAHLVIDKGVLVSETMHRESLTEEELMSYLREKGIDSIKKVRKAFIEPDGEISVALYAHSLHTPSTTRSHSTLS